MEKDITKVITNIERIMSIEFNSKETNLQIVKQWLDENNLHYEEDYFLESLLGSLFTMEENIKEYVVEFMEDGYDYNQGLALKDVA